MTNIQKGHPDFHGYIDFINYAFGMNGASHAFDKLLPKLYADGKSSADDTYFAFDDGKIIGTVLSYPLTFHIGGATLTARGIGSVATHPRRRGEGFMKDMMKTAIDDMKKEGIALSVLGGRRGRYAHFGFEKCDGMTYYTVNRASLSYHTVNIEGYTLKAVKREDTALLDRLHTAMQSRPYYTERERETLYDILVSWYSTPYAFFYQDTLVGWAVHYQNKKQFSEFEYLDPDAIPAMLALSVNAFGEMAIAVPAYEEEKAALIDPFTETVNAVSNECFLILDWEKVLSATLGLKAATRPLVDGTLTVRIEDPDAALTLTLSVKDGKTTVSKTEDTPALTLTRGDAARFFFRQLSPDRRLVNPEAASWLPLPLFIHEPDNV